VSHLVGRRLFLHPWTCSLLLTANPPPPKGQNT